MAIKPLILLVPSLAAVVELPRRLCTLAGPRAGLMPFKLRDFVRALAEPTLLAAGRGAWDNGHDALLAARLLEGPHGLRIDARLPRRPFALALARTLRELRLAGVDPREVARLAASAHGAPEHAERLRALAGLYADFDGQLEGHVADPAAVLREATRALGQCAWLRGAEVLIVDDLETSALEREFLYALGAACPVRVLRHERPAGLRSQGFASWAEAHGIESVTWDESPLAPLAPGPPPAGLARLAAALFEPPAGGAVQDGSVELLTAASEAAEVRAVVRRLLRAARSGMPFEQMGVVLPRPETYAPLVSELLERLGVPFKLHPSLPLRFGRAARSLLLLLRCRGLERSAVMEFLTFAPIPFAEFLAEGTEAHPARWDELSRDARIVSGLERWIIGLRAHAEVEREAAAQERTPERRLARERRAAAADALLRVVELLSGTLDSLFGEASWLEWSTRLEQVLDQWIGQEQDQDAVREVLRDLASLSAARPRARWEEVESVLEARFEWERLPLPPVRSGAVHVGALDAMAGLPFELVAVVGLVEAGFPGVLRPDPLLLDAERLALEGGAEEPAPQAPKTLPRRQLLLFEELAPEPRLEAPPPWPSLPTTQARALEQRQKFQRALGQAQRRLILSYPRADARSGRERLPSLFFVAAASALEGRALSSQDLQARVAEDQLEELEAQDGLDRGERDRIRLLREGREAAEGIAAGSPFFKQSRLAAEARWSSQFTPYDGLVASQSGELKPLLDPLALGSISASRLATFSRCGFQYLLQHVLKLEPALEPEERKRLDPLERGNAFHEVAERFLRERRERGELPVQDTQPMRDRLMQLGDEALDGIVAGSPPRFAFLWERECARFRESLLGWLKREAELGKRARPLHFELSFGLQTGLAPGEPHQPEPLEIELGDGRTLRVNGRIDRIDERPDGTLVLRDYKTGKAPKDDGGVFRGGKQLQIPFYVLGAARLLPGKPVVEAFLDYVDGGRQVAFDPALVHGERFRSLLRGLVDAIAEGNFVQEPSSCEWCDFTSVCGPRPLLELRRRYKLSDKRVQSVLRLRDVG